MTSLQAELQALPYDADKAAELDAAVEAEAEAVTRCRAAADETAGQLGGGASAALHLPWTSEQTCLRQLTASAPQAPVYQLQRALLSGQSPQALDT